jgi:hypothetical protein
MLRYMTIGPKINLQPFRRLKAAVIICTARRQQGTSSSGQEFDRQDLTDKVNMASILLEMLANGSVIVYGIFPEVQFVNVNF